MIWVGVAILGIWLLMLTIVVAVLVRYVGTMSLAQSAGVAPSINTDFDAEGPTLGSTLPADVSQMLDQLAVRSSSQRVLFFFSPGCGTCVDVAREVVSRRELRDEATFFIVGAASATPSVVAELLDALAPSAHAVVTDERARTMLRGFGISAMPYVVVVRNGQVASKLFAKRVTQMAEFLDHVVLQPASEMTGRR